MKKAKIILTGIAALAVAGAALAFKVKSRFLDDYCTTNVDPKDGGKCTIPRIAQKPDVAGIATYWYTLKPSGGCPSESGPAPCKAISTSFIFND